MLVNIRVGNTLKSEQKQDEISTATDFLIGSFSVSFINGLSQIITRGALESRSILLRHSFVVTVIGEPGANKIELEFSQ